MHEISRVLRQGGIRALTDWDKMRVRGIQHLLLFERQVLLHEHVVGKIPQLIEQSGLEIQN